MAEYPGYPGTPTAATRRRTHAMAQLLGADRQREPPRNSYAEGDTGVPGSREIGGERLRLGRTGRKGVVGRVIWKPTEQPYCGSYRHTIALLWGGNDLSLYHLNRRVQRYLSSIIQ
eukprot:605266-Rhodomonas_salina.1